MRLLAGLDTCRGRLETAARSMLDARHKSLQLLQAKRCLSAPQYYTEEQGMRLDMLTKSFAAAARQQLAGADRRLAATASKLDALSPLKVLGRGYAIGYDAAGDVVDSVSAVQPGQELQWQLTDGRLTCRVTDIQEANG
jgi:exodeoxyribonuclease VII large subunit